MTTSVLGREFETLALRNAELLNTQGETPEQSKELEGEFETNLTRLEELKALLEKEDRFGVLQQWASEPIRAAAAFAADNQPGGGRPAAPAVSAARQLLASEDFKGWLAQIAPNGQISDSQPVQSAKFPVNTLITGGDGTSGGAFFERDYTGIYVPYIQPTLTVRDLVLNATTDADLVEYVQAVAHTNAAAEAAEATTAADPAISGATPGPYVVDPASGIKAEGAFTWQKVTQTVQPIAEGVPITKRALMNGGQMIGIVDGQLRYDLERRLNGQMISGNGSDPNFRGIRNTSGILTQAFSNNVIETLRKGKTKVASTNTGSGKPPTGAVMTPETMEKLDLFRVGGSTTTDGPFLLNPYADRPQRVWGMTLVEEPAMTTDRSVVGYFRDAVLWDRQVATVQVFDQHKDFAARNLLYLLAEWWGTFGVLQPKSFCDCTMA